MFLVATVFLSRLCLFPSGSNILLADIDMFLCLPGNVSWLSSVRLLVELARLNEKTFSKQCGYLHVHMFSNNNLRVKKQENAV